MAHFKVTYPSGESFNEHLNDANTVEEFISIKFGTPPASDIAIELLAEDGQESEVKPVTKKASWAKKAPAENA